MRHENGMKVTGWGRLALAMALAAGAAAAPSAAIAQETRVDAPRPHARGQSVTPSYEGWYENPDGGFSMVFGYFNRNHEEHLDVPVGPDNRMEPGPADRGQPTHFLPRRQTGVFAVVVPADFGTRELTWSLTAHGETISIPGHLRPEWRIDALEDITNGNTPPVLRFTPGGETGQGPGGVATRLRASPSQPVTLTVLATDDGTPRARGGARSKPGVVWSKYRGPGRVTFSAARPPLDASGRAVTRATFAEPGEYVLRVLAWDESGEQRAVMAGGFFCCWTNGFAAVDVR